MDVAGSRAWMVRKRPSLMQEARIVVPGREYLRAF